MARAGLPPTVETVVVEDFVNYHNHDLPMPAKGDMVRLDLRWGDAGGDEAVVQVGLATPRIVKAKKMLYEYFRDYKKLSAWIKATIIRDKKAGYCRTALGRRDRGRCGCAFFR